MGKIKKILENELVGGTQNTDVYPVTSVKAVYDENNERLDHILNRRGVINISTNYNADHIAEVLTLSQAIAKVPSADRVLGFKGTFLTSEGWQSYQFNGNSISEWSDKSKWDYIIYSNSIKSEMGDSDNTPMSQKYVSSNISSLWKLFSGYSGNEIDISSSIVDNTYYDGKLNTQSDTSWKSVKCEITGDTIYKLLFANLSNTSAYSVITNKDGKIIQRLNNNGQRYIYVYAPFDAKYLYISSRKEDTGGLTAVDNIVIQSVSNIPSTLNTDDLNTINKSINVINSDLDNFICGSNVESGNKYSIHLINDSGYYSEGGVKYINSEWVCSKIAIDGYTKASIYFSLNENAYAKSYFADENDDLVGSYLDSSIYDYNIPSNAKYLYVSSRLLGKDSINVVGKIMPYMVLYTGDSKPKLALVIKDLYDIDMKSVNDSIYILKSLQNKSTGGWGSNVPISELEINVKNGHYFNSNGVENQSDNYTCFKADISPYVGKFIILRALCYGNLYAAKSFISDSDNNIITWVSNEGYIDRYIPVPSGAKYIYISSRKYGEDSVIGLGNISTVGVKDPKLFITQYKHTPLDIRQYVEIQDTIEPISKSVVTTSDKLNNNLQGVDAKSTNINIDWVNGYYNDSGTTGDSTSWTRAEIAIDGYDRLKIKFTCPISYSAKTYFVDNYGEVVGDYIGSTIYGDYNSFIVPKNATKLRVSNRVVGDGIIEGTESPEVYGVVDGIPRLANINDVNNINIKKNKFLHFSLDDFKDAISDLVTNGESYSNIFDNSTFALLKEWHDKYGIVVSLYLQRTMADVPKKFASDFINNSSWLKFGYHGNGPTWETATYDNGKQWWNDFVNGIMTSVGSYDIIDRVPRNDYFHGTKESCKGERDANCGCLGFLGCDDWEYNATVRKNNYYLTDEQSKYLDVRDRYYDYENQLCIFKTDFRLEQIAQRWGNVSECLEYYQSAKGAMQAFDLIVFSHEWNFTGYKTQAEAVFQWAIDNGYRFDYPMNIILK